MRINLENGLYKTDAGSTVEISGKNSGVVTIDLDWLEERNACCDCQPFVEDGNLYWECDYCGGGWAELHKIKSDENAGTE